MTVWVDAYPPSGLSLQDFLKPWEWLGDSPWSSWTSTQVYWFAQRPGTGWEKKHAERAARHRAEVEASGLVHLIAFGSGSGGLVLWVGSNWVAALAWPDPALFGLGSCHGMRWALVMGSVGLWPWSGLNSGHGMGRTLVMGWVQLEGGAN